MCYTNMPIQIKFHKLCVLYIVYMLSFYILGPKMETEPAHEIDHNLKTVVSGPTWEYYLSFTHRVGNQLIHFPFPLMILKDRALIVITSKIQSCIDFLLIEITF